MEQTATMAQPGRPPSIRWSGFSDRKLGMYLFLASEAFLFGGLIGGYLVLRSGLPQWPPPGNPELPKLMTAINTVILVSSSATFHWAESALRAGKFGTYKLGLFLTILLGSLFLGIQANEWGHLIQEGLSMKSGVYGPSFFTLTGCHGLHVFGGVTFLLVVFLQSLAGVYSREKHTGVELAGMYWHFVDIVWIVLFTLLYLI